MGRLKNGINGLVTGKIGANYYYVRYGKQEVRAAQHINKPRSEKQLAQQQRLTLLKPLFSLLKLYIRVGFELTGIEKQTSANNCARSYNLRNAVKGEYPNQEIDYPNVRLSQGDLTPPLNPLAAPADEGIRFTWDYNSLDPTGTQYDRTMLMAWFPEEKMFYQMIGGAQRKSTEELLVVDPIMKGKFAETYISFITDDRSAISNSVYTGRIEF